MNNKRRLTAVKTTPQLNIKDCDLFLGINNASDIVVVSSITTYI